MKISQKLILGFLVVALLITSVGVISINTSQEALQESIGKGSVTLAHETLDKIDRTIYHKVLRWVSYAYTNPRLHETLAKSNQEFENLSNRQEYINNIDRDWKEGKDTPSIQEILNNELSNRLRKRTEFYEEKSGYNVFPEAYITNKYGVVIASTGRTSDYLQADEEWYQKAVTEKEFWVGEVEYDESSNAFASDIVINLYDENGNFIGILKVILNIEEIINIIKELEEEVATREFELLTKDGKMIYATEEYVFFEDISKEIFMHFDMPLTGESTEHMKQYFIAEGDKPGEGEELFAHTHSKGYRDYKGLGWILIVEHETEEIFAPVFKLRNTLIIISGIITIIAVLIGLFLAKSITKPIQKLSESTKKIKQGNLNIKCEVKSKDEIGELAQTFDEMRLGLKDRNQLLNSLLTSFKGKFGNIATILVRKDVQQLVEKNPRIEKILPKSLGISVEKAKKLQREQEKKSKK